VSDEADDELIRLDVHGLPMANAASASARAVAEDLDFAPVDVDRVERLARRLCELVCRTDFDDPHDARFGLSLRDRPAALTLEIVDRGLPISLGGETGRSVIAELLAHGLADRVEVVSDGDSNTISADVRRGPTTLGHLVDEDTPTEQVDGLTAARIEQLQREHLASLARCTWRVYGHSYVASFLYHPEETWKVVESGRLHSVVALDNAGAVIGHMGIELESRDDRVGDVTLALTDPRYRGHHVLAAMEAELAPIVAELELVGTLAEAVTPHTITQRARVEGGAVETGVLLGFIPATMAYRGFPPEVQGNSRQSAVLSYLATGTSPTRAVFLPAPYRELIADGYERMGLDRPAGGTSAPLGSTRVDIHADHPRALAALEVTSVGDDAAHLIDQHRRELCAAGTEVVYAELPLDDPATPQAVDGLRERGFFYAGFIPDIRGTDVLRMQYLDVDVDTEIIQLYSDDARRLLDFQLADRS